MNSATVTSTEIRREFRDVLNDLLKGKHVEVTNHAKLCAVIVPPDWYALATAAMAHADLNRFVPGSE